MYNWFDLQVEKEVAQERYQVIVEGREAARARQRKASFYDKALTQLGERLVTLGHSLQGRGETAVCDVPA